MSLSPASATKDLNETFAVDVVLDSEGEAVSGATAILNYDTAKMSVVDDDSSLTGVNITGGPTLTQTISNTVDTATGQINYNAGNLGSNFTGRGVIATIHFKSLAEGTAQVSFVFNPSATRDTSQVAAASGPTNLLSTVNDGTYTIETGGGSGGSSGGASVPVTGVVEDTLLLLAASGVFLGGGVFFGLRLRSG